MRMQSCRTVCGYVVDTETKTAKQVASDYVRVKTPKQ